MLWGCGGDWSKILKVQQQISRDAGEAEGEGGVGPIRVPPTRDPPNPPYNCTIDNIYRIVK